MVIQYKRMYKHYSSKILKLVYNLMKNIISFLIIGAWKYKKNLIVIPNHSKNVLRPHIRNMIILAAKIWVYQFNTIQLCMTKI